MEKLKSNLIESYRDGCSIEYIRKQYKLNDDEVKLILNELKETNRYKRTFTDELKKIIAERDLNGISRRQISLELELNINTIQKACKEFGQANKEKASSDNAYTEIPKIHNLEVCPNCKSRKVNEIDSMMGNINTMGIYCRNCGYEHFMNDDKVYKVNWEYLEE